MAQVYDKSKAKEKEGDRDLLRMSLSSTMTGGLDLGDLSAVWNRGGGAEGMDAAVAREIQDKYVMNKWLSFENPDLEEEFLQKYFYSAIKTHRSFILIISGIFVLFILNSILSRSTGYGFVMHFVIGGGTFLTYFFTRMKNFHTFQLPMMVGLTIYNVVLLGVQRQVISFAPPVKASMQSNDARSLMVVYTFAQIAEFLSLRYPFKVALGLSLFTDLSFFVQIAFFGNLEGFDYLEGFVYILFTSGCIAAASYANELRHRNQEIRRAGILKHTEEVAKEKIITEKLLLNILPHKIAKRLIEKEDVISDGYSNATVLFADLVGWTDISHSMSPIEAIELLNEIVSSFDKLTFLYKIEKIKTIGDAYLVACGLPEPLPPKDSSRVMAEFALDMLKALSTISGKSHQNLQITIGIHTGPVVAGVIGKTKFLYDLWGDSVNTASRMQSHGDTNRIHVTSNFYELLEDEYNFEKRPVMYVKGKGDMQTYFLLSRKDGKTGVQVNQEYMRGSLNVPETKEEEAKNENEKDKEENPEEGAGKRESRKKRKAREAMLKRNQLLDEQMDSQIQSTFGVWFFPDKSLEEQFRAYQKEILKERYSFINGFLIFVQLIVGLGYFRFDVRYVQIYYLVMGGCIGIEAACGLLGYFSPKDCLTMTVLNFWVNHIGLLIVYGILRAEVTGAIRYSWAVFILFVIVTFMASRIPYRQSKHIVGWTYGLSILIQFFIKSSLGFDFTSALMYISLCYFSYATAKSVEKHLRCEFLLSHYADEERKRVIQQREESERLLYNILPESVIQKIRDGSGKVIDTYANASVMFADIVGFTVLSSKLDARSIVTMLNSLFSQVDEAAERKGLEKIKTIGDAYMVVAGLPYPRPDHAKVAVELALEMVHIVQSLPEIEGLKVNVRIGVHSGDCVGGIIGASKMVFDIWGENVNIASKMESNGTPGCVNISHVTRDLIGETHDIEFEKRDKTVKYNGREFQLYYARPFTATNRVVSELE